MASSNVSLLPKKLARCRIYTMVYRKNLSESLIRMVVLHFGQEHIIYVEDGSKACSFYRPKGSMGNMRGIGRLDLKFDCGNESL